MFLVPLSHLVQLYEWSKILSSLGLLFYFVCRSSSYRLFRLVLNKDCSVSGATWLAINER